MIEERTIGPARVLLCALQPASSRREAELAAETALLDRAFPEGYVLSHTQEGAPFIAGRDIHMSISHSRSHAALALCRERPVGIDIETVRPQLARVASRVFSEEELAVYGTNQCGLLRAWTLKEALYKAALTPGVDFRHGICLPLGGKKNEATVTVPGGAVRCFVVLASEISADGALALVAAL